MTSFLLQAKKKTKQKQKKLTDDKGYFKDENFLQIYDDILYKSVFRILHWMKERSEIVLACSSNFLFSVTFTSSNEVHIIPC